MPRTASRAPAGCRWRAPALRRGCPDRARPRTHRAADQPAGGLRRPELRERLRQRRTDGAAADRERRGDLLVALVVVVAGDDDRPLALGQLTERRQEVRTLDGEVDLVARRRYRLDRDLADPAAAVPDEDPRCDDQEPGSRAVDARDPALEAAHERLL